MKMDFGLAVNEVLPDEITRIDGSLVPPRFHGDKSSLRMMQMGLAKIINKLGEMSAATQGLNRIITSDEKLFKNQSQFLYLIKDAEANSGTGGVVGFLKVGRKNLYLHDSVGAMHEIDSFCILDFYVLGDMQRKGYGKRLFDLVLRENNVSAHDVAIDGPSQKMVKFLRKHYGLHEIVRQSNNFVVSAEFFVNSRANNKKALTPGQLEQQRNPVVSPRSFIRNDNSIGSIIHGDDYMAYNSKYSQEPKTSAKEVIEDIAEKKTEPEVSASPERPTSLSVEAEDAEVAESLANFDEGVSEVPDEASLPPATPRSSGCQSPSHRLAAGHIHRPESQLNKQGYFDIKYYHNQLW